MLAHITLLDTQPALALSVFLLTLAYEDGATLLAATLATAGKLDVRLGFASAFLGIWAGDMGLYFAGTKVGGRLQQSAVDGAIEEMVFSGGTLNLKLLGGTTELEQAGRSELGEIAFKLSQRITT